MNNQTWVIALVALVTGGALVYLYLLSAGLITTNRDSTPHGMHRMPNGEMMRHGDMGMMHIGHDMTVSSEREFITEMIPHHQEAVDTAREVLARGATTPEIRTLVENIIVAQEAEISTMKEWHLAWYGTPYEPSGNYVHMMRSLAGLSGREIDRAFLTDMIPHHQGAIMMARSVQPYIEREEIRQLTQNIIDSQMTEIVVMRELLANL